MDRNTILGFVLIGAILFTFSWLNQPSKEQQLATQKYNDSIALVEKAALAKTKSIAKTSATVDSATVSPAIYGGFAQAAVGTESIQTLQNDLMEVKVSNKGGRIYSVRLKKYKTHDAKPLILFQGEESSFGITLNTRDSKKINTADLYFQPSISQNCVTMRLNAGNGRYLDYIYTIDPQSYLMKFDIKTVGLDSVLAGNTTSLELGWYQKLRQQEKGHKNESRYSNLYFKYLTEEVDYLSDAKDDSKELTNKIKWVAYKDQFFSSILIAKKELTSAIVESKIIPDSGYIKEYNTRAFVDVNINTAQTISFNYYFGPNHYPTLTKLDNGLKDEDKLRLDRIVPLGASVFRYINKIAVIPMFNFFEKFISSYGLIILLLTLVIKLVLFPLTYKSYLSSAKMRVLRPQVEELNAKFPGQDKMMERQKATMDLYKRAGVNPLSGCLPMLLQMPILIAMYMFFPSSIELRQQSFLWATDLSTYDSIYSWTTQIPVLSQYYGNHISLFCLLMTATNIVYTKFNMDATNTGQAQMPGMKTMMYIMPLMFLFFLNEFASGLSYYYFISTLITILQTLAFRQFINEEKLLAKLQEKAKKPVKKSGFMARVEEMQKRQQQIARDNSKKGKR